MSIPQETVNLFANLWFVTGLNAHAPGKNMLEINGVRGFLTPGDVDFIVEIGKTLPKGGKYLEIGSFMGLSSILTVNAFLSTGNLDGQLICVDTWEGSEEHRDLEVIREGKLFEQFEKNIFEAGVAQWVRPLRGDSLKIAELVEDQSLDIVFVDGDHSFDGCLADLRTWFPKLKKQGARFVGHDARPNGSVARALQTFCLEKALSYNVFPPPGAHYGWEVILPGSVRSV